MLCCGVVCCGSSVGFGKRFARDGEGRWVGGRGRRGRNSTCVTKWLDDLGVCILFTAVRLSSLGDVLPLPPPFPIMPL